MLRVDISATSAALISPILDTGKMVSGLTLPSQQVMPEVLVQILFLFPEMMFMFSAVILPRLFMVIGKIMSGLN